MPGREDRSDHEGLRDWVALVLALALALAMNLLMFGVVYDAVRSDTPGLSENATQIITTAFGGILGVLGSYLGFRAATSASAATERRDQQHALDLAAVASEPEERPPATPVSDPPAVAGGAPPR